MISGLQELSQPFVTTGYASARPQLGKTGGVFAGIVEDFQADDARSQIVRAVDGQFGRLLKRESTSNRARTTPL